jgi:hypothetical protein
MTEAAENCGIKMTPMADKEEVNHVTTCLTEIVLLVNGKYQEDTVPGLLSAPFLATSIFDKIYNCYLLSSARTL